MRSRRFDCNLLHVRRTLDNRARKLNAPEYTHIELYPNPAEHARRVRPPIGTHFKCTRATRAADSVNIIFPATQQPTTQHSHIYSGTYTWRRAYIHFSNICTYSLQINAIVTKVMENVFRMYFLILHSLLCHSTLFIRSSYGKINWIVRKQVFSCSILLWLRFAERDNICSRIPSSL